ncbi:MAG: hypothetical protein ABIG34_00220 [Candidatus Peregrinibacteria bacterium]
MELSAQEKLAACMSQDTQDGRVDRAQELCQTPEEITALLTAIDCESKSLERLEERVERTAHARTAEEIDRSSTKPTDDDEALKNITLQGRTLRQISEALRTRLAGLTSAAV